jgi:phage gpG-like protein
MTGPMVRISIKLEGDQVVDRMLKGIEERAQDMSGAWPSVLAEFRKIVTQAFATEGKSTDAGAWKPLRPSTRRERLRQGFSAAGPILQRTLRLQRSLTSDASGSLVAWNPRRLLIGTFVEYFPYHQSSAPRSKLPRRAMIALTADQRTQLMHPIRLWLTGRDPTAPRRARVG